jgi:hypothetical protein
VMDEMHKDRIGTANNLVVTAGCFFMKSLTVFVSSMYLIIQSTLRRDPLTFQLLDALL